MGEVDEEPQWPPPGADITRPQGFMGKISMGKGPGGEYCESLVSFFFILSFSLSFYSPSFSFLLSPFLSFLLSPSLSIVYSLSLSQQNILLPFLSLPF